MTKISIIIYVTKAYLLYMRDIMDKYKRLLNEAKELSGETDMEDFAEKRGSGAEKISDSAKEKGGLSLLTYNHFRVKLPYYKKAAEGSLNMDDAKKEYNKHLEKLHSSTNEDMNLSQTAFQELMGKIEVLGELLLESNE
tara:strand:- start:5786 stop:6202 length:417 start_codon:yes stop_codon:yes gene_type:complete